MPVSADSNSACAMLFTHLCSISITAMGIWQRAFHDARRGARVSRQTSDLMQGRRMKLARTKISPLKRLRFFVQTFSADLTHDLRVCAGMDRRPASATAVARDGNGRALYAKLRSRNGTCKIAIIA